MPPELSIPEAPLFLKHSTAHSHLSIAFPAVHYLGFLTCFIFRPFFFLKNIKTTTVSSFPHFYEETFFFSSMVLIFYLFLFENLWKKLDFLAGLCKRKRTERKIPAEMYFSLTIYKKTWFSCSVNRLVSWKTDSDHSLNLCFFSVHQSLKFN